MAMPSYMDPGKGCPSEEQQHMGPGLRLTCLTPVLKILFLSAPSIFQVSLHQASRLPFAPLVSASPGTPSPLSGPSPVYTSSIPAHSLLKPVSSYQLPARCRDTDKGAGRSSRSHEEEGLPCFPVRPPESLGAGISPLGHLGHFPLRAPFGKGEGPSGASPEACSGPGDHVLQSVWPRAPSSAGRRGPSRGEPRGRSQDP